MICEEIKKFKGIIVCCDRAARVLTDHGIKPDYIVTAEAERSLAMLEFFDLPLLKKIDVEVITSEHTRNELIDQFNKNQIKYTPYIPLNIEPTMLPDVGMTAIHWAKTILKPDRIVLIGFEHEGDEYPEFTFRTWVGAFWGWVAKWPDEFIVNCSEGGVLYGICKRKSVKKSTLGEVNTSLFI